MTEKQTPDEQIHDDAEAALADQTPVYPVTKLTRRKEPSVRLEPTPKGHRMILSPAELGGAVATRNLLARMSHYAEDGSDQDALAAMAKLDKVLDRYPVEWVEPKPK